MISRIKFENHIRRKLEGRFIIDSIEPLRRLPKDIWYFTWSLGESESNKAFKVVAKDLDGDEVEMYIQVKYFIWFIIRSMVWRKVENKYKRM